MEPVFVFARDKHGAILHQGFGPQGNSFAIPTCHVPVGRDLSRPAAMDTLFVAAPAGRFHSAKFSFTYHAS